MQKIKKELKIGVLSALAMALFLAGMNYLTGSKAIRPSMRIHAEYANSMGLVPGNPVYIRGFQVGKVSAVTLDLVAGVVRATFDLDDYYPIPENAEAMIFSADLSVAKAVKIIIPESASAPIPRRNGKLRGTLAEGLLERAADMVENEGAGIMVNVANVTAKLGKLADKSQQILDQQYDERLMIETFENIRAATASLRMLSRELQTVTAKVDRIATDAGVVTESIRGESLEITGFIRNIKTTTDSIAHVSGNLATVVKQVDACTASIEGVLRKIDQGEGAVGLLVNDRQLYDSIAVTAHKLNVLLEEVNKNPRRFFDDIKIYLIERKKR